MDPKLTGQDVTITTEIETEPWGERYFQITDPNRVVYQFVQWIEGPGEEVISPGSDHADQRNAHPDGTP